MKPTNAEQEFQDADWKLVGLRLLVFARYWAKSHYGWYGGRLLPVGKTPEDVACEVYVAYSRGDRKFSPDTSMWVQLKSATKSVLWNLHQLKEGKVTRSEEPEFFEPVEDGNLDPEAALRNEEFCQQFFACCINFFCSLLLVGRFNFKADMLADSNVGDLGQANVLHT